MHVLLNDGCDITTQVHLFPGNYKPDFIWTIRYLNAMPDQFFQDTFGMIKSAFPEASIPDKIHTVDQACMKKCGLPLNYFDTAPNLCDHMKATNYTVDVASYIKTKK